MDILERVGGEARRLLACGVAVAVLFGAVPARAQGTAGPEPGAEPVKAGEPVRPGPEAEKAAPETADAQADRGVAGFFRSIEVTGFVDGYYAWAFNEVPPQLRNFDVNHNELSLSFAKLSILKAATETSRAGFRFDLGAGQTADMVNAFEPGGPDFMKYVGQAYGSYLVPVGKGLTVDFGKFVTPHGGEVIESKDNWNYSRGLLFALAVPYYHMGARVGYALHDKVSLSGFIVNGWNNVRDNNAGKTVGASLAVKPTSKLAVTQNYMVGEEQAEELGGVRNLFDTVVSYSLTDKVSLLGNVDYGRDSVGGVPVDWYGFATYLRFQGGERWAFSPRYEWLKDSDGFATGVPQTLQDFTVTGEYKVAGLITRVEWRTDVSSERFFTASDGDLDSTQSTLSVGLIYAFSSK